MGDDKKDDSAKTIKIIKNTKESNQLAVPIVKRISTQKRQPIKLKEKNNGETVPICKIEKV
jgi:hypothetical protein